MLSWRCHLAFVSALFLIGPAISGGFDLGLAGTEGSNALVTWDAEVAHEYRIEWGPRIDEATNLQGRVHTAVSSNCAATVARQGDVGFFRGVDQGRAFKMLDISNEPSSNVVIRWSSESNKSYNVLRAAQLSVAGTTVALNRAATPPANSFTDTTARGLGPYYFWVEETGTATRTKNVAGLYRLVVPHLDIMRQDFESFDGNPLSVQGALGSELPVGAQCALWEAGTPSNYIFEVLTEAGWMPNTNFLTRGRGFWLLHTNWPTPMVQTFKGEVPDNMSAPTTSVFIATNLNLVGYPYPVPIRWTNTTLAQTASYGDTLYCWDATGTVYDPILTYESPGQWDASPGTNSNPLIRVGMGFFYSRTTNPPKVWTEAKPYSWP